ncbi:MAG: UDP-N-acetylmuramoyl-L-alanine--D-glutamate ligase [Planctomycetota bacterium]|nr:MAG: UDP-N-acetylmuramoyl-L-alanine--D-glutamate ligase [Planctomycetota bacterium]
MSEPGIPDFSGRRVTVMGLGLFSGGVETVRFLAKRGAEITVTDLRKAEDLQESLDEIKNLDCEFHLGGHIDSDFTDTDYVVANPAVPPDSKYLALAREAGVPVGYEIVLFFRLCPGRIVGVTGSNGKTTTTHLTAGLLEAAGAKVHMGGNVGHSLLNCTDSILPEDLVVLEISSAQLAALREAGLSPGVGVITNITPNHLDWHGTFEHYRWSKAGIFASQKENDAAVLNADDEESAALEVPGRLLKFGWEPGEGVAAAVVDNAVAVLENGKWNKVLPVSEVPLPGKFNVMNILAALAAVAACDAKISEKLADAIRSFKAVPHRLENIGTWDRVTYYNDSIATTPESVIAALGAIKGCKILIAGGYDKGLDYAALALAIEKNAEAVVVTGPAGAKIAAALENISAKTPLHQATSLREAVLIAIRLAPAGSSVLLSPAAASYDEFRNFMERGEKFMGWVTENYKS